MDVTGELADLECHGQVMLANPDFVARRKVGAPLKPSIAARSLATPREGLDHPLLHVALAA